MVTLEYLKQNFVYDLETGVVSYADLKHQRFGERAGKIYQGGYIQFSVSIGGASHPLYEHRVGWMLHNDAEIPQGFEVDHIDYNRSNNRLNNLRLVSKTVNQARRRCGNPLGRGVYREDGRFISIISIYGKSVRLGSWGTAEEAAAVYQDTFKEWWGEAYWPDAA